MIKRKMDKAIKKKDDRGPLDLTRRIDELERENKKLKEKLKNAVEYNKLFMKLTP
mgnify:CR=1 FL=1